MANNFFNAVFGKKKDDKQNNSAGTSSSSAARSSKDFQYLREDGGYEFTRGSYKPATTNTNTNTTQQQQQSQQASYVPKAENAAKNDTSSFSNVYKKAQDRQSSLYSSKYKDILKKDDYAKYSVAGESKANRFMGDDLYDFINNIGNIREETARAVRTGQGGRRMGVGDYAKYGFMTDDEKGVYNYLYETKGKKSAEEFLKYLQPELNAQWASGSQANLAEKVTSDTNAGRFYTYATAAVAPARGFVGLLSNAADLVTTFSGKEIDPNSELHSLSNNVNVVREAIGTQFGKKAADYFAKQWDNEKLGKWFEENGAYLYGIVTSGLDSAVNAFYSQYAAAALPGNLTIDQMNKAANIIMSTIMSNEIASVSIAESKTKGYSDLGAVSLGFTRGMISYLTEKYGGDWVNKLIKGDQANFFIYAARAFFPEAIEEIVEDIGNEVINIPLDLLANTDESYVLQAKKELEANGSQNVWLDLVKVIIAQEVRSGLAGGLSALGTAGARYMGFRSSMKTAASTLGTDTKTLSQYMNNNDIEDPTRITLFANLANTNTVEEFDAEFKKYNSIGDAIDAAMVQRGQRFQSAINGSADEDGADSMFAGADTRINELRIKFDTDVASLSKAELEEYLQLVQNDLQSVVDPTRVADLTEERNAIVAELSRRQSEEAAQQQPAQAEPATQEPVAQEPQSPAVQEPVHEPAQEPVAPIEDTEYNDEGQVTPVTSPTEGDQDNVSVVGDQGQDRPVEGGRGGISRTGTANQSDEQNGGAVESKSENGGDGEGVLQQPASDQKARDQKVEPRHKKTRTLSQRLFRRNSGEATRISDALGKFFGTSDIDVSEKGLSNIAKERDFCVSAIAKAIGMDESAARTLVMAWLADSDNQLLYSSAFASNSDFENLSDEQAMLCYEHAAAEELLSLLASSDMDAQTLADLLGVNLNTARNILENAKANAIAALAKGRVTDAKGNIPGAELRAKDRQQARDSGANSKIADRTAGEDISDADTIADNEKYVPESNDHEVDYGDGDCHIYLRNGQYVVVDAGGYVVGRASGDNLAAAVAYARKHSAVYGASRFRLFNKDGTYVDINTEKGGRIFKVSKDIFDKENRILRQRSGASDVMEIKYQNQDGDHRQLTTTKWFEIDLSVHQGDKVGSVSAAMDFIRGIIGGDVTHEATPGMIAQNGKEYVFFGMTANGAKKGRAIMVEASEYERLRNLGMAGIPAGELKEFNASKLLTAMSSIFTPSNNNTGVTCNDTIILSDIMNMRQDILRPYMMTAGKQEGPIDRDNLIEIYTNTYVREAKAQGISEEEARAKAAEIIPERVDELIGKNKAGTLLNILADVLFSVTDGTGFMETPDGYSTQIRGPGGFKGQVIGCHNLAQFFADLIPLDTSDKKIEYTWQTEKGDMKRGIRHILQADGKDHGVEIMDRWGNWQLLEGKKCILFESACKFASQFDSAEEFYRACGKMDIRSVPRENVYGAKLSAGALEGATTRGLAQFLRSQPGNLLSEEDLANVISDDLSQTLNNIAGDANFLAKLLGVNFDSKKPPKTGDNRAQLLWAKGKAYLNTEDGRAWVLDKMAELIEKTKTGKLILEENSANFQWIDPDIAGIAQLMTSMVSYTNQIGERVFESTPGGGLFINGLEPLKDGEIFNANV